MRSLFTTPDFVKKIALISLIVSFSFILPKVTYAQVRTSGSNNTGDAMSGIAAAALRCSGITDISLSGALNAAKNSISGQGGLLNMGGQSITDLGVSQGSQAIADVGNWLKDASGSITDSLGSFSSAMPGIGSVAGFLFGGGSQMIPVDTKTINKQIDDMKQKQNCFDAIANAQAKNLLAQVNKDVAKWINTGLNGNPFFPKNMGDYYQTIANNQTKILLGQIQKSNSPFSQTVAKSVVNSGKNQTNNSFSETMKDTLAKTAGTQKAADDFRKGVMSACPGTLIYNCLRDTIFQPGNSLVGSEVAAKNEAEKRKEEAVTAAKEEVAAGKGAVPAKKCVRWDENGVCTGEITVTPGTVIATQAEGLVTSRQRALEAPVSDTGQILPDFFGETMNDIFSPGGFSGISDDFSNALNNVGNDFQSTSDAIQLAETNTLGYQQAINANLALTQKLKDEVIKTSACYGGLDNLWSPSQEDGAPKPSLSNPLADDLAGVNNGDYDTVISEYDSHSESLQILASTLYDLRARLMSSGDSSVLSSIAREYSNLSGGIPTPQMIAQALSDFKSLQSKEGAGAVALKDCQEKSLKNIIIN